MKKQVVRAFIQDSEKKFLLVKHVNKSIWTLPGGHIEKGENPYKALKREIKEEFSTKIDIIGNTADLDFENIKPLPLPLAVYKIEFLSKKFGLVKKIEYIFRAKLKDNQEEKFEIDTKEIAEYKWFTKSEILALQADEIYGQIIKLLENIND